MIIPFLNKVFLRNKLFVLLILTDFVFIFLHGLLLIHILSDPFFDLQKDFGFPEIYQYIKEFWIVLLFLFIFIKSKKLIFLAWTLVFIYFLIDDSIRIHETLGHFFVNYYDINPGFRLRSQDFGELIVSFLFGLILLIFLSISYFFYSENQEKKISINILKMILALVFFGVFVDMLHIALPFGKSELGIIEDGGEMIVMSVILSYVYELSSKENMD